MKQLFSIFAALLILVSGMNLSLSAHFCHGQLVAGKVSLASEKASCDMEMDAPTDTRVTLLDVHCCSDVTHTLVVDKNYSHAHSAVVESAQTLQLFWASPLAGAIAEPLTSNLLFHADASPPGYYSASNVSLPSICVFRI